MINERHFRAQLGELKTFFLILGIVSCNPPSKETELADANRSSYGPIESLIPADKLSKIKAALPKVAFGKLQGILTSSQTLWYDHDVMTPSYQDSLGANTNAKWPDLVAASEDIIGGLHDRNTKRWQFPFGTTAGADHSTNIQVENFISLPQQNGQVLSIPIWKVRKNYNRYEWMWVYPVNTTIGEVIFITDGDKLLPSEIRMRTRYASGWAMNVYRPFPTAKSLASAVKSHRPDWMNQLNLKALVSSLEDNSTLSAKTMAAQAALSSTFHQDGWIDTVPEFGDESLVRELLTTTVFSSSFETAWKQDGAKKSFAASTASRLSIVPNNFEGGMIQVNDSSCMRCHKEGGRLVSEFYDALYLYGEVWGKDGIFSFHPFDESRYPELRSNDNDENRSINPRLKQMGIFENYDATRHVAPFYPVIDTTENLSN